MPMPATPETRTMRAEWRSADAWKSSFTSRSSWSLPKNGASITPERCDPAVAATTLVARKSLMRAGSGGNDPRGPKEPKWEGFSL